jgi:hypothetical protein
MPKFTITAVQTKTYEIEMNEWRKLGAQRAREREEAGK